MVVWFFSPPQWLDRSVLEVCSIYAIDRHKDKDIQGYKQKNVHKVIPYAIGAL